ncbi:TRAP transporter small permease [Nitratireductor indicus]|uniref:TRAP transporter small permease n=1 Tax=Nitratireductor indicus TaxID=721133 RepID=UPI0028759B95|nr:TRAP transporter small permease [Nitratireductor indicus]MDS1138384.1 TRAP transporter small permease [Nitratireductor indicus]
MWQAVNSLVDRFSRMLAYLSGGAILLIAIMQMAEIVLRNGAGISLPFVWEYASYLHVSAIFLGAAFTLRTDGHIRVTLIRGLNPRLFEILATVVGLAISAYLTKALFGLAWGYGITGRTSGTINNVPLVIPAIFVSAGAAMLTLQLALRLVQALIGSPLVVPWNETSRAD